MAELVFARTCNYWIDAGIVGLYNTLQKPLPKNNGGLGSWEETIKGHFKIKAKLFPDVLRLEGEEKQIDRALSYVLEWVRLTLYDVSTEKQIANPEKDGRIKQMSTLAGKVVASGKQAKYTYFRQEIIKNIGKKNIFLPLKQKKAEKLATCVFCGNEANSKLALSEANEVFVGQTLKSSPFVEGDSSNRCFHSNHKGSVKCWRCGFATFFSPLLLFYRRRGTDTYYILPYIPGNLKATHLLYRSLSGKRGLARVLGSEHTTVNYESAFKAMPPGMPLFTLSFYYDLYSRLLPQNSKNLLQISEGLGIIDERGAVFQTSLFLKRDTTGGGGKSFILRETTIDRSAYFIKLFLHLKRNMDAGRKGGKLFESLQVFFRRASETAPQLQRLSVLRAAYALTEGKHVYRYLLSILPAGFKEGNSYEVYQISMLFKLYDQWLFRKEDTIMAKMVEQANNAGYHLSQNLWRLGGMDEKEKQNLIKRYYYAIERAPSPVKFLEQARHACHKAGEGVPREMVFHDENGKDDIKKFEVYRVYFLAGMLNGMLRTQASATGASQEAQKKED
ncbi:MAG: hypothetical protein U9R43_09015 [Thermodesulfobacteriota bacterium]|nr:hypothetical protein [Thermodesulfobacteriota bacterium]